MILQIGDRILIRKRNRVRDIFNFKKKIKYDWIANVISEKGDIMDASPPSWNIDSISKYSENKYILMVVRPNPRMSVAQKAIWLRKIKTLEGKPFNKRKSRKIDVNTFRDKSELNAAEGTYIADYDAKFLNETDINPNDYDALIKEGLFEIVYRTK